MRRVRTSSWSRARMRQSTRRPLSISVLEARSSWAAPVDAGFVRLTAALDGHLDPGALVG